jgi:hypothetical protein
MEDKKNVLGTILGDTAVAAQGITTKGKDFFIIRHNDFIERSIPVRGSLVLVVCIRNHKPARRGIAESRF